MSEQGTVRVAFSFDTSRLEAQFERVGEALSRVKRLAWMIDLMESRVANESGLAEASGIGWDPSGMEVTG